MAKVDISTYLSFQKVKDAGNIGRNVVVIVIDDTKVRTSSSSNIVRLRRMSNG
jgi:hypothetical protein